MQTNKVATGSMKKPDKIGLIHSSRIVTQFLAQHESQTLALSTHSHTPGAEL